MDIFTTYSVRIDRFTRIFQDTVSLYRRSVDFFIRVILLEKEELFRLRTQNERVNAVEKITVITSCRPEVKYDFGKEFYKFPSYYRRLPLQKPLVLCLLTFPALSPGKRKTQRSEEKNPVFQKQGLPVLPYIRKAVMSVFRTIQPVSRSVSVIPGTG